MLYPQGGLENIDVQVVEEGANATVIPIDPNGKYILIAENLSRGDAEMILESVGEFMKNPDAHFCLLFGDKLRLVKVSDVKELRAEAPHANSNDLQEPARLSS